jgi:ADP-ribose pyrophosphatase YjhB (NUDIX family)
MKPGENPPNERISVGVACTRFTPTGMEILLVKKRYTYAFNKFVNGRYRSDDRAALIAMFDEMTADEKLDILSLNFTQIWYRIWLNNPQKTSSFYIAKSKFENTFMTDGGVKLRHLMSRSYKFGTLVWEIPKGRKKSKNESDIQCGLREFTEETNVIKKQIKLMPDNTQYSYISDGTRYTFIYYYAIAKTRIDPYVSLTNKVQVGEIIEIKWMNLLAIRQIDGEGRLYQCAKKIFKFMKRHAK